MVRGKDLVEEGLVQVLGLDEEQGPRVLQAGHLAQLAVNDSIIDEGEEGVVVTTTPTQELDSILVGGDDGRPGRGLSVLGVDQVGEPLVVSGVARSVHLKAFRQGEHIKTTIKFLTKIQFFKSLAYH